MSDKQVAIILSGCGFLDGSEIYEATLIMLALDQMGVDYLCMAHGNVPQKQVINHRTEKEMPDETRDVMVESARLARGRILDVVVAIPEEYDGLIFPGGFGVAKNLSDFASAGSKMWIDPMIAGFAKSIRFMERPIGMTCIAPVMAPLLFGEGVECTIGNNPEVAAAIEEMGGKHIPCPVDDCHVDRQRKIVSTPAYMYGDARISEVAKGINRMVEEVVKML